MDYDDHDHDQAEPLTERASLTERAGYRSGEAADSAIATTQAMLAGRVRKTVPAHTVADHTPPSGPVVTSESVALAAATVAAVEADELDDAELSDGAEIGSEHSSAGASGTDGSSGNADTTTGSEVSATTDMGAAAHVGATGVVSAASPENLDTDDVDDDEVVTQTKRAQALQAQAEQHSVGAASEEPEVDQDETDQPHSVDETPHTTPVEAAPSAPGAVQRLLVSRGEANTSATYVRQAMCFDGSGTAQVKEVPKSLIAVLREDLATMTNPEFAGSLPVSVLVTAFVAVQLGTVSEADVDDNTVTAMRAFRMSDHRTGVLEEGLANLIAKTSEVDHNLSSVGQVLKNYAEKTRLLENALTYLVTERIDPTVGGNVAPSERQLMGGKYRQVRERLRRETDREIQEEKTSNGRPIK